MGGGGAAVTNEEIETLWVQAWDELLGLSRGQPGFLCLLPDGSMVDVEAGLGWLQEAVYQGRSVSVEPMHLRGKPGAHLSSAPRSAASP